MKKSFALFSAALMTLSSLCTYASASDILRPVSPRCEYLTNPIWIDVVEPRLSWCSESGTRGQMQTAYHILVASTRDKLDNNIGDLWDTGKVISNQSIHVTYTGKPLVSRMRCSWKVRVWE